MKNFTFLLVALMFAALLSGQETLTPTVEEPIDFDVSPPLRDMIPTDTPSRIKSLNKDAEKRDYPFYKPGGDDPVWQREQGPNYLTDGMMEVFEGIPLLSGLAPSDDNGDVGPNHYVQTVNSKFQIFDKEGNSLYGPENINTLFTGISGGSTNDGDPIVLYDQAADRWMISQFSISGATKYILIAVSVGPDPTGSYYRWTYSWGSSVPDYPKFGVWHDAYLMGLNCGTDDIVAFDRSEMLAGVPATSIRFDNAWRPASGLHCVQPLDNDGPLASSSANGLFITINDDAWGGSDQLWIYELNPNWAIPIFSTFSRVQQLGVASFDSNFGGTWNNIPQPGTTQKLEVLPQVLMYRAQYRNFGTYQSIVCCHDVDVNGSDQAGIRWYEVRKYAGGWYVYQQGTYAPDSHSRWMGSIAQNASGEIALGYTVASSSVYPSIRFTGRKSSDPLGTMGFAEGIIHTGSNSQTSGNRWGDYTSMSVDPTDDKTFWYTSQYTLGGYNWHTKIAAFQFDGYCAAGANTCDEFIARVEMGDIDNSSDCDKYRDYSFMSTEMPLNGTESITVTNGTTAYGLDQCGIWVDWNKDEDFNDANEQYIVSNSPGTGPYVTSISPPPGLSMGDYRMRIRITYTGDLLPCGTTTYGEVEDYTITLTAAIPNVWTGVGNKYWHQALNWSLGRIPIADDPVEIPNVGYQPVRVDDYPGVPYEECASLLLESGATLDFYDMELKVHGDVNIYGEVGMLQDDAIFTVEEDIYWESGSTLNVTEHGCFIKLFGLCEFRAGANVNPDDGFFDFHGTSNEYIRMKSSNCSFSNLRVYKSGGAYLGNSLQSNYDLVVNDYLFISTGAHMLTYSNHDIIINDRINYYGTFDFSTSSSAVIFEGGSTYINKYASGSGSFYDVVFNSSVGTTANDNLLVENDITIQQGAFTAGAATTITIGGNWTTNVGPGGFVEGDSRVIFNGPGHQYIFGDENFNILEADMGAALRLNNVNYDVTCNVYDWTSGGIDIIAGNFTALDLFESGLFGGFWVNPNGTINLTNDSWVDLNCELHNFGGIINVSGTVSDWPYSGDAEVEMTGGIIDFKTCGITIRDNGHTLLTNITGGTIRTAHNFVNERTDIDLSAAKIELYGPSEATLGLVTGIPVGHLDINKGAVDDLPELKQTDRNGKPIPTDGKANNVNLTSDVVVNGDLEIVDGSLTINGNELTVLDDIFVNGTLNMTNPSDVIHSGSGTFDQFFFYDGSTGNISSGNIYLTWGMVVYEGASFTATSSNTIYFNSSTYMSGLSSDDPNTVFGNIIVDKVDGDFLLWADGDQPIVVNGDFTLAANNLMELQSQSIIVHGNFSESSSSEIYLYIVTNKNKQAEVCSDDSHHGKGISLTKTRANGGYLEIDTDFTLNGLMDLGTDGAVLVHGRFDMAETGSLIIDGGSFISDAPYSTFKAWEYLRGNFVLTDGLFELSNNSPSFASTATTTVSGGVIRSGTGFETSSLPGVFVPTGGLVEMLCSSNPEGYIYCSPGNSFYNLTINSTSGGVVVYGLETTIQNNLEILNGGFQCNSFGNPDLFVGGNWTNNTGLFEPNLGTVTFYGSNYSQITTDETFYNLVVDKSLHSWDILRLNTGLSLTVLNDFTTVDGTLNLEDNSELIIGNNVYLGAGSGLNAFFNTGLQVSVGGNWTNENTTWDTFDGYSPGTEILTFNGSADQVITSNAPREELGNLIIDKSGGQFRPETNINVKGDLLIENQEWNDNTSGLTHYFERDFTISPTGAFLTHIHSNTVVFKGTADQSITNNHFNYGYFKTVYIDKTDWPVDRTFPDGAEIITHSITPPMDNRSQTVTLQTNVDLQHGLGLFIDEGTLDINGNSLYTMGDIEINDGGVLIVDEGAQLRIKDGNALNVNNGGTIEVVGMPAFPATITHRSSGFYGFEVQSGGTILAENAIFEYMGIDIYGINILSGAIIGPGFNFDNCEFNNGNLAIGGSSLLTINNDQDLTIYDASFPDASASYNVAKDSDQGQVTFIDFTGDFSGEDYDWDPNNRIDWYAQTLEVTPLVRNVTSPAGSTTFDIISNLDWTISESVPWLTVTPMNGTGDQMLIVNYSENTAFTPRTGNITVSADEVDDVVVSVIQAAASPTLSVVPSVRNVLAPAGSTTFSVTSNTSWTVSESIGWFSVSPMGGSNNGTLTVNYTQNFSVSPRSGQITVSAAGVPDVIVTVNQAGAGAILTVTPGNRNVSPPSGSTSFNITSNTGWTVSESVPWFSALPGSGSGNDIMNVYYLENTTGSPRIGSITVTATGGSPSQTVTVTQLSYPTHSISLIEGWMGLSSYIMPADNDIVEVFDPVSGSFIIAATMTDFYYPAGPVNTIIDWESQSAYKLKMGAAATLPIIGTDETNKTLTLSSGWSLIPVICNYPVDAASTLSTLDLEIAKDVAGPGVLWPDMSINTLGMLTPGMAYYVLLNSGDSFTYPPNSAESTPAEPVSHKLPDHPWNSFEISSSSHIIAIVAQGMVDILPGDVIGAFAPDGFCYGVAEIGELEKNAVISVFADDATTDKKDGFDAGEPFSLKLYNPESGEEYDLEVLYDQNMPNGMLFENEGLSAVSQLKISGTGISGNTSSAISIYPNPTNDLVWVTGVKGFDELVIVNSTGRIMFTQFIEAQDKLSIDMSAFSNGIYQLKLTGSSSTVIRKIIKN